MLEKLIQDLIAALNANTAAHMGNGGAASTDKPAASTDKPAGGKAAGGKAAPKAKEEPAGPTVEEMQAALGQVKEKFGAAEAKAIIKSFGKVEKMGEIPADKVKAVFDAATAKLAPADTTATDDDDDI